MPDINLDTNDDSVTGKEADGGLVDAPAKSPLEQASVSQNSEQVSPVASSAMPDATPQQTSPATPLQPQVAQEETASVPDTDKFLESILEGNNSAATGPSSPVVESEQSVSSSQPDNNQTDAVSGGEDAAKVDSQVPFAENVAPPVPSDQVEASEIPITQQPEGDSPKIKDDIRGLDSVMNGITPPNEPSQPISDNPVSAMQSPKSSRSPIKALLVIVVLVGLGLAGYFAYNAMFGNRVELDVQLGSENDFVDPVADEASSQVMSSDDVRKQDLAQIHVALKSYFSATGKYPLAVDRVPLNSANNILEKELVVAGYLSAIPADPDQTKYYAYKSDGATFSLTAVLDSSTDPEATFNGGMSIYEITHESVVTTNPNSVSTSSDLTGVNENNQNASVNSSGSMNPFYPGGTPDDTTGLSGDENMDDGLEVII